VQPKIAKVSVWIFGAAIVLQFVMPFVYPIVGNDAPVHLNWLSQFPRLFREGNLYPRWMPDSFWGFGSPAFYFYTPLVYWFASIVSYIFTSPVAIYQIVGCISTCASVWTCFLYLKKISVNKSAAIMGALLYGIFPYRLLDLYLRNSISEHVAFIFLPLIFLSVELALGSSSKKQYVQSIVVSGIGWAGLLLTNIPTSYIIIFIICLYILVRCSEKRNYSKLFPPLIGAVIGAMIAAIYLLPILKFNSYVRLDHLWDRWKIEGITGYAILDFLNSLNTPFHTGKNRFLNTGLIIIIVLGCWVLLKFFKRNKKDPSNINFAWFIIAVFSILIQIPFLSNWLWEFLLLFKFVQLTWRFDILIVLASSVIVAREFSTSRTFIGLASACTIIIATGYFITMHRQDNQYDPRFNTVDAREYLPSRTSDDFGIALDHLKEHSSDLPIQGNGSIGILSVSDYHTVFRIQSDSTVNLVFRKMYFPTWTLKNKEGKIIAISSDSLGRINAIVSSGSEEYTLSLEKSQAEKTGEIISIFGLSLLSICILLTIFWRNPKAS
jgi:hypothetical protein